MADTTISALTALAGSGVAAGDRIPIDDIDAAATKYVTAAELQHAYTVVITTALGGSGVHATQDKIPIHDNGVAKHILVTELQIAMGALATDINTGYHATEDVLLYLDNGVASKITIPNLVEAAFILTSTALAGSGIAGGDQLLIGDGTAGSAVPKYTTITDLFSALAILGFTLADVPGPYADQAAAATALTGTGRLWYQTTTGLLGITLT